MKKGTIKLGFKQEVDGKEKLVQDVFEYHEPATFDEMLVDAGKETILEYYNAHRRVMCQNGGARAMYADWKIGKVKLEDLQAYVKGWKPGSTYSSDANKAEKMVNAVAASPEMLAAVLAKLGISVEQLRAMQAPVAQNAEVK